MEDALLCPVCLLLFDEGAQLPKLLRCGHTFCATCIGKLSSTQRPLSCPTCRQATHQISNLATNYAVLGLATQYRRGTKRGAASQARTLPILHFPHQFDESRCFKASLRVMAFCARLFLHYFHSRSFYAVCPVCAKDDIADRCTRCATLFCRTCSAYHAKVVGHSIEALPPAPAHMCTLEQFCDPCGVSFCSSCPVDHVPHTLARSANILLERSKIFAARVENSLSVLAAIRAQIESRSRTLHEELVAYERTAVAIIRDHCQALSAHVDELTSKKLVALDSQTARLQQDLVLLNGADVREATVASPVSDSGLAAKLAQLSTHLKAAETREQGGSDCILPCTDNDVRLVQRASPLLLKKLLVLSDSGLTGNAWIICPAGKNCHSPAMCTFLHPTTLPSAAAWTEACKEAPHSHIAALNVAASARQQESLPNDPLGFESERMSQLALQAVSQLDAMKRNPDGVLAAEALGQWYRGLGDANKESEAYSEAAARGSAASLWRCVQRLAERDSVEAFTHALAGALQGHPQAMRHVGLSLLHGRGIRKEEPVALAWLRRAAERGDTHAQKIIASLYIDGKLLALDPTESLLVLRRAAEAGSSQAQFLLAERLAKDGDARTARSWYQRAAEAGHSGARAELRKLQSPGETVVITLD